MKRTSIMRIGPLALASGMALGMVLGIAPSMGHAAQAQSLAATTATDPASVLMAFEAYIGVDVDAGLALITDDSVLRITPPPQGTPGLWTGKAEVRQALQYSKDHMVKRVVTGTPMVDGTRVTDTVMVTNDVFVRLGVAPVQFTTEAVVEGGKIKSFATVIAPSEQGRVAAAATAAQNQPPQAQADPASIYLAFARAVGTSDIDGTLAMMTDDAVLRITPPPPGTPGLWTGKAEIRQGLEYARDHSVKHEFAEAPQVDGNRVTALAMLSNSFFQDWGVAPVRYTSEAIIEGGKIKSFTNTMATSEQARVTAAAQAYQAAHATQAPTTQPPAGMPRTGAEDATNKLLVGLLLTLSLCLLVTGTAIRRDHRLPGEFKQ